MITVTFLKPQTIIILILSLFWILTNFGGFERFPVQASTTQLEYRVRQLESKISRLEGQINRLRNTQISVPSIIEVEPTPREETAENSVEMEGRRQWISGDPLFDRLATMVIELKQDIQDIQERIQQLES